jgi:hypothetical protein
MMDVPHVRQQMGSDLGVHHREINGCAFLYQNRIKTDLIEPYGVVG